MLSSRRAQPAGRDNCIWLDVEDTRWGLENEYKSLIVQYRASTALQKDRPFRDAFCRPLIKVTDVIWQCHSLKWDQSMILHCHCLVGGNNSWCGRETVKYYRIWEFGGRGGRCLLSYVVWNYKWSVIVWNETSNPLSSNEKGFQFHCDLKWIHVLINPKGHKSEREKSVFWKLFT